MTATIKLIFTTSVFLLIATHIQAQVGIGTNNPHTSALLEVRSNNKGVLLPSISLTGTNDVSTITSPATGLLVYNSNNVSGVNAVTPGFYYFNGTAWMRLIVPTDNAANVTGTIAVANGGTGATSAAGAIANLGGIASAEKGANNGVATLGNDGKIPSAQIPAVSFQSANVVADQTAMLALSNAVAGSIAIRTDLNKNFVLSATPASTLSNWIELATPAAVTSVNGKTGPNVSLTASDLSSSTIGNNIFTLTNPSAVSFPRFNADNTVSALSAADFRTAIGAGSSNASGTVTSAALSLPNIFTVTGSPITSSGTISASLTNQNANVVLAGPASGSAATPAFRSLVASDIPTLNQNTTGTASNVTGIVAVANGGTGLTSLGSGIPTFLGTPSSANLATAITDETGTGSLVFGNSPSILTPTITSGNIQFPSSLSISPTTHASSKRAAVWIDGWSLLQDINGNGTKNFSIGQTIAGPSYPSRLYIHTDGNIGIGNTAPNAKLDIRTTPSSTSDPGDGYLGIGSTSTAANTAGAGAIRYSTASGGILQYSNGTSWNTLTSNVSKSVVVASNSNAGSYLDNTAVDVVGWSEEIDTNSNFDPTTGKFTAPRSGNYVFTFNYAFQSGNYNSNTVIEAWMSCSNVNKRRKQLLSAPSGYPAGRCGALISFTINLTNGESIWPTIWHNTGSTRSLDVIGGNNFVNLSIVEL